MDQLIFRSELPKIGTLVVKTGSRILTAAGHEARVTRLIDDLATLKKSGIRVILVSSGAIAHGMRALGLEKRPTAIPMQQACAAIGQNKLMQMYERCFADHGIPIGQVLLTWDDLRAKKRYLNLRNTLFQLLDVGALPIVNENDSVGVEEIQFGNNDVLGAQISLLTNADVFVNLTDVGGIYDKNPRKEAGATHIPVVTQIASVQKYVSESKTEISVGGMGMKLKAADMVTRAGIFALVGDGYEQRLLDVLRDERAATLFLPSASRMPSRFRWIAFTGQPQGSLIVDEGAERALVHEGKSLLPAGIVDVKGTFKAGDMVKIVAAGGKAIGQGLANYPSDEVALIKGCRTSELAERLLKDGREHASKQFDEVIHRDNMVVF